MTTPAKKKTPAKTAKPKAKPAKAKKPTTEPAPAAKAKPAKPKAAPQPGTDALGARLGSKTALVNSVLSKTVAKKMPQIQAEAGLLQPWHNHCKRLVAQGLAVKTPEGYKLV